MYATSSNSQTHSHHFVERPSPLSRPREATFGVSVLMVLIICLTISVAALSHAERGGKGRFNPRMLAVSQRAVPRIMAVTQRAVSPQASVVVTEVSLFDAIQPTLDRAQQITREMVQSATSPVWDCSMWLSQGLTSILHGFSLGSTGQSTSLSIDLSRFDSAMLGFSMIFVLFLCLAGPLYLFWTSWKIARQRVLRYR
jgi:hypothetical protein